MGNEQESLIAKVKGFGGSKKPIFIEEIGKAGSFVGGIALPWHITNLQDKLSLPYEVPPDIYMVQVSERPWTNPLLNRGSAGAGFFWSVKKATSYMLLAFAPLLEKWACEGKKIIQIIIPNGGLPMDANPFMVDLVRSHHSILTTYQMKLSRKYDPNKRDYINCLESYRGAKNIEADIIMIMDTAMASGSTIENALKILFRGYHEIGLEGCLPNHKPEMVLLFTICGSKEGLVRPYQICKEAGVKFIPVFYNAIFEVTKQNNILDFILGPTDLPVWNPTTITHRALADAAERVYNHIPMCTVGDTGNRLVNTPLYFLETMLEVLLIEKNKGVYCRGGIDLNQPEWNRIKLMLNNEKLVKIAWEFYEAQMILLEHTKITDNMIPALADREKVLNDTKKIILNCEKQTHPLMEEIMPKKSGIDPIMDPLLTEMALTR